MFDIYQNFVIIFFPYFLIEHSTLSAEIFFIAWKDYDMKIHKPTI